MVNYGKGVLICGLLLLALGYAYLVYMAAFMGYRLGPMDMISVGLGFVGFAMAWPAYKESQKG